MRFFSRFGRRSARVAVPAGTAIYIGAPADPLPPEVIEALAVGCAADRRILAAYAFLMKVQLPGEVPHHCIGLALEEDLTDGEFADLTEPLGRRSAHLVPSVLRSTSCVPTMN